MDHLHGVEAGDVHVCDGVPCLLFSLPGRGAGPLGARLTGAGPAARLSTLPPQRCYYLPVLSLDAESAMYIAS